METSATGRSPSRGYTRLAIAIVVAGALVSATIFFVTSTAHPTSTSSSVDACSLLTTANMEFLAWNGAGHEIPGINQSAPPWDYQSIYDHIQQGWQSLCLSPAFVSVVDTHGAGCFSWGGGFVNAADPDNSQAGLAVIWSQTTSTNCTQYIESWSIFIVNGTASMPSTTANECIH